MRPLLEDPALEPSAADIGAAHARAEELLKIRFSSRLFRLGSAARIQRDVSFPTGTRPGVIVMKLADEIVVVFNATPEAKTETVPGTAAGSWALHPVQAGGGDPVVKQASASGDTFTVPGRTVAVFVRR
jgi:Domain of unknown function (DUF3372)